MHNQNLFSKKKNSFIKPILITFGVILLLGFGFWINNDISDEKDNVVVGNSKDTNSEIEKKIDKEPITKDLAASKESNVQETKEKNPLEINDEDEDMIEKASKAYYLVKEVDGLVKIFYYSASGEEKLIRITDITYSLLSEPDQQLFETGIIKYSIDELNELLQDFES